jgi:integrase
MAYFVKLKTGWRAQVARQGVRASQMFPTKAAAQAWAAQAEADILRGQAQAYPDKTVAQALDRYIREVSARKRGARAEALRLESVGRDFPTLAGKVLHTVTAVDLAAWRDARRLAVSDSTVVREANTLRHVWSVAKEWGWCGESPWGMLKLPREAHARGRQTLPGEIKRLVRSMGYVTGQPPLRPQHEVALAYLVAHHTALRAGEVLGLSRLNVDLVRRVIRLDVHKTLEQAGVRHVPFTRRALRLLRLLDGWAEAAGRDAYFTISAASLDALFRKVRDRLMIEDLHFHDARAAALTRLARRMDVMRLARISGHKDLRQLMGAYYRESAADIASAI